MVKKLSEIEKKASTKVLGDLREHMKGIMGEKMAGLKKVTVASNTKEGLKKGLSTAEEVLEAKDKKPVESAEEELSESPEIEESEDESAEEHELTASEIDEKIKELLALKEKLA
jgi:hypothetical protein